MLVTANNINYWTKTVWRFLCDSLWLAQCGDQWDRELLCPRELFCLLRNLQNSIEYRRDMCGCTEKWWYGCDSSKCHVQKSDQIASLEINKIAIFRHFFQTQLKYTRCDDDDEWTPCALLTIIINKIFYLLHWKIVVAASVACAISIWSQN